MSDCVGRLLSTQSFNKLKNVHSFHFILFNNVEIFLFRSSCHPLQFVLWHRPPVRRFEITAHGKQTGLNWSKKCRITFYSVWYMAPIESIHAIQYGHKADRKHAKRTIRINKKCYKTEDTAIQQAIESEYHGYDSCSRAFLPLHALQVVTFFCNLVTFSGVLTIFYHLLAEFGFAKPEMQTAIETWVEQSSLYSSSSSSSGLVPQAAWNILCCIRRS